MPSSAWAGFGGGGSCKGSAVPPAYTVRTARLIYHLNMELTLLHSNPCGIFPLFFTGMPVIHGTLLKFPTFDAVVPFSNTFYQLHMEFYHLLMVFSP